MIQTTEVSNQTQIQVTVTGHDVQLSLETLQDKLTTKNRKGSDSTNRAVILSLMVKHLPDMVAYGGTKYQSYKAYRQAVLNEVPETISAGSATMQFNNLRVEINSFLTAFGTLVVNGTAHKVTLLNRDPRSGKPQKYRIPTEKYIVVDTAVKKLVLSTNDGKEAFAVAKDGDHRKVISKEVYLRDYF